MFEESIAQLRKILGDKHPDTLDALGNYGRFLQAAGDLPAAEGVFRQTLALDTEVRGAGHAYVGYDHVSLGTLLHQKGEYQTAEQEFRTALRIYAATLPPDHQYVASAQTGLARALLEEGHLPEATTAATRALLIWRGSLPETHPQVANAQAISGRLALLQGNKAEAERLLTQSFRTLSTAYGLTDARTRDASRWLADLYRSTNRADLANQMVATNSPK